MIAVANAPVSYGAFELTVGVNPNVPEGAAILELVKSAGYRGIDLGPVGYLGDGPELASALARNSLGLAGGYLEIPFHDDAETAETFPELDALLDACEQAAPVNAQLGLPAPRPTIAVMSQGNRRSVPGRAATDTSLGYTTAQWGIFARNAEMVATRCRNRGFPAVFHNEVGTNVEAPWELERVLSLTSFDLCLDTGHLLAGGGDPVEFFRTHESRIAHIHVKSADLERMETIKQESRAVESVWEDRVFCKLGEHDLDTAAFVTALLSHDYDGWVVVEQDIFPDAESLEQAQRDQISNRQYLASLGLA